MYRVKRRSIVGLSLLSENVVCVHNLKAKSPARSWAENRLAFRISLGFCATPLHSPSHSFKQKHSHLPHLRPTSDIQVSTPPVSLSSNYYYFCTRLVKTAEQFTTDHSACSREQEATVTMQEHVQSFTLCCKDCFETTLCVHAVALFRATISPNSKAVCFV